MKKQIKTLFKGVLSVLVILSMLSSSLLVNAMQSGGGGTIDEGTTSSQIGTVEAKFNINLDVENFQLFNWPDDTTYKIMRHEHRYYVTGINVHRSSTSYTYPKISKPTIDPSTDGYILFKGWFADSACEIPFDFSIEYQTSQTVNIYAGWEKCLHEGEIVAVNQKNPTCTEDGYTKGVYCAVCGFVFGGMETIPATGHHAVTDAYIAPTCTQSGLTEGSHCDQCGEIYTAQEKIAALGHQSQFVAAKEATCTESGTTEGYACSVCGKVFYGIETIPALKHDFSNGVCIACGKTVRQCEDLKVGTQIHSNGDTRLILKLSASAEEVESYRNVGLKVTVNDVVTTIAMDDVYDSFYNDGTLVTVEDLNCTYVAILEIGNLSAAKTVTVQGFYTNEKSKRVYGTVRTIK